MDTIFYNGRINTLDNSSSVFQSVGVLNGRIVALGSDEELMKLKQIGTETIDLKGAAMFPGFMEAHNHLTFFAYLVDAIDLSAGKATCIDDIKTDVSKATQQAPPGTWIKGSRYAEYFLAENRHPQRTELDEVSPEHPVVLFHTSFHACTLNSLALKTVGITPETPSPQGGIIEKDASTGELTGVLHDQAMMNVFNQLFFSDLQAMSTKEQVEMCAAGIRKFAEKGLVSAADALVVPQTLNIYQETLKAGQLAIRIYTMNYEPLAEGLVSSQIKTGFGSGRLRIGPIKIFADGGMSNRTAAVKTPFKTPPHGRGVKTYSPDELKEMVRKYHDLEYQIAIHAQGDDGIGDVLDAFESVLGSRSSNPLRHRIEHGGCLYPELLQRTAAMNIPVSVQPVFFSELGDGFIEAFGPELADRLYPFKSMLEAGIVAGGSSDCPVSELDPRKGLVGAVKRESPSGKVLASGEALTMDQALRLYTQGSAYLSFDENDSGTIEIGKRADFTVMAEDPRAIPIDEVLYIPFTMTVVDGEVAWSNSA